MISGISSTHANTVAPYAPLGRQPVGQESTELKTSSFKALEQAADSARSENRRSPEDNPNAQAEQQRLGGASQQEDASSGSKDVREQERQQKEQQQIAELASTDREVRAHEQAHAAVAGAYAGTTTYNFVRGPDGVSYAVGGEVSISTSAIPNDPEATIRKAAQIRQAANAPADPSSQDRRVAAAAASLENQARAELVAKKAEESRQVNEVGDEKLDAQKAADKKQAEEEDSLREQVRTEEAKRQADLDRSNAERADILSRSAQTTFDISRRLVEIGAVKGGVSVGTLLNSRA